MNTPILSSYDNYIEPDIKQYWFERLVKCVSGCRELRQINVAKKLIEQFEKTYPDYNRTLL